MHGPGFFEPLVERVREGRIPEERIDLTCRRLLKAKFELGLFENPFIDVEKVESRLYSPVRRKLALEAARKRIILFKNHKNFLPLNRDERIMLTGPNADNQRIV